MEPPEQIRERILARFPGAEVSVVTNLGPAAQHSLLIGAAHAAAIATFLRDDPVLRLDTCSNVTGVDWPEHEVIETVRRPLPPEPRTDPAAPPRIIEEKIKRWLPGYLEVVYHLYSVALKHGPVVLRLRTVDRAAHVGLPSLTPVWRACEFQEREVFDLFGVKFAGHPDLRRILMWDEFQHHPMRKDYLEPDDYEWEPTPHDAVLAKSSRHYPAPPEAPRERCTP